MPPLVRRTLRRAATGIARILTGRRDEQITRRLVNRVTELHAQRDTLKDQRDQARSQHDALKIDLQAIVNELADAGGRFTALDYYAGEEERLSRRETIAARLARGEEISVRDREVLLDRVAPSFALATPPRQAPGPDIAFVTVASDRFAPGLEALIRSLKSVYPSLSSDFYVYHDGTLSDFVQRRLRRIHDRFRFIVPDMAWLDALPDSSPNHRRVGRMGYMNIHGLGLEGYRRIILLDADLLVLDDISRLWAGEDWIVCADCGDRDYTVCSPVTGSIVFNSGVVSVPGSAAGPAALAEMKALARSHAAVAVCSTLDRFSDQKVWNLFLKDRRKDYAPLNYNCNIRYLARALDGHAEAVSILHFAGAKPWVSPSYLPAELIQAMPHTGYNHPRFWSDHHRHQLLQARLTGFRRAAAMRRSTPRRIGASHCVILPELGQHDARTAEEEVIAFDRAIHLPAFTALKPDHLVFGSHDFFGGWLTQQPRFPQGYLDRLRSLEHRPALWAPFYFRELFEQESLDDEFEINYLLFEEPFRRFVDQTGRFEPDPDGFLDDARNDALTMGIPAALAMGFRSIAIQLPRPGAGRDAAIRRTAVDMLRARGIRLDIVERRRDAA